MGLTTTKLYQCEGGRCESNRDTEKETRQEKHTAERRGVSMKKGKEQTHPWEISGKKKKKSTARDWGAEEILLSERGKHQGG